MLVVYLKHGQVADIPNFEKVSYLASGQLKELSANQFDHFYIHDSYTYNFQGSSCISIKGSEILYTELEKN